MQSIELPEFINFDFNLVETWSGRISLLIVDKKLSSTGVRLNKKMNGALQRAVESKLFDDLKEGEGLVLAFPTGLNAESIQIVKLYSKSRTLVARYCGSNISLFKGDSDHLLLLGSNKIMQEILFGFSLKNYRFNTYKKSKKYKENFKIFCMVADVSRATEEAKWYHSVISGTYFTRDLVNEPANILGTVEFSTRLQEMKHVGLEVQILDEAELKELGMRSLLAVGQGSESPSKVAILKWNGGALDIKPLILVGKGVVFDSGGISLKPAGGMEEMTMDMGGAGLVAGIMKTIALRRSKTNVIGLIGLVENMPDGKSQRPGDVIKSMKGDTIEVINTDAEGRLVLCDLLWYAQTSFTPSAIIDFATLTGAIIVGLGHENAGLFSNSDKLSNGILNSAEIEEEGVWRLPLSETYDRLLKSRIADMANVGGKTAGAITAAKFLQRFVSSGVPWAHIDIAGVAFLKSSHRYGPRGASGWGVSTINRFIIDHIENKKDSKYG